MRHSRSESLQNDLVKNFDEIMLFVYEEATKPIDEYSESEHEENKSKFYKLLKEEIKDKSQPNPYIGYDELWKLCWEKIMYANKKAESAGDEINAMEDAKLFKDYNSLGNPEWNHNPKTWKKIVNKIKENKGKKFKKRGDWQYKVIDKEFRNNHEEYFQFVKKINDKFEDKDKIGDVVLRLLTKTHEEFKPVNKNRTFAASNYKIDKYVRIARKFKKLIEEEGIEYPLKYFVGDLQDNFRIIDDSHLWDIHKRFEEFLGKITALHLMMELGFWVIKPDIVMTKLFHQGEFLSNLNKDQILDKNDNYKYTNKTVYKEMINVGRKIANEIEKEFKSKIKLKSPAEKDPGPRDKLIRLAKNNIIRALDLFLVKFGQEPDPKCGITRNLEDELKNKGKSFKDFINCIDNGEKLDQLFQ